jgi:hypothetical protein
MTSIQRALAAWLIGASISHAQGGAVQRVDSAAQPPATRVPVPEAPLIDCQFDLPDTVRLGTPVPLTLRLRNGERRPIRLLTWGTPFEGGWWQPFVRVFRDEAEVPYIGPMAKRGTPEPAEYLPLPAGATRRATLDLRDAFDLSVPGTYVVSSAVILHDVLMSGAHHRIEPRCATVQVTIHR